MDIVFAKQTKSGPGFARYDRASPMPPYALITHHLRVYYAQGQALLAPGSWDHGPEKLPLAYVRKVFADFEAPSLTLHKHWNKCAWLTYGRF